jgi:hypothetical protein
MQTPLNPLQAALAVVVHERAVLLIQRHDSAPDRWFLPGGRLGLQVGGAATDVWRIDQDIVLTNDRSGI